jgi:hypothetical protein
MFLIKKHQPEKFLSKSGSPQFSTSALLTLREVRKTQRDSMPSTTELLLERGIFHFL